MMRIRTAAVLGAGTMGAQLAAHFANGGIPVLLLDVSADAAREGLRRARSLKPDPFFTRDTHTLIETGSFDDLPTLRARDWVVEAIVERLDAKRALLERVEPHVEGAVAISSNTSGIPLAAIAEGRSESFRGRWLGTHFFNPPRYLHLVEVIATADTRSGVVEAVSACLNRRLGKGVVAARDTPGFIANRIGTYGLAQILRVLSRGEYTIEDVDAITGPAIGRPKSATFRTMDLAGLDVLAHVMQGLAERLGGKEGDAFRTPGLVATLVERGSLGAKAGEGFYRRTGAGEILVLDPGTLEYGPSARPQFASIEAARNITDTGDRIRTLFLGSDRVGGFLRATLAPTLFYAAQVADRIAHDPADVDAAMRWGFGWELGPFETLRALGAAAVISALDESDREPAARVFEPLLQPRPKGSARCSLQLLACAKARNRTLRRNPGASLVDLGGGMLCLEFHSKMNAIGGDSIQMLEEGVREAEQNFDALVVGNDAANFSAGANLMLLLLEAQDENWDEVDLMVRAFQRATMALRHAAVPVIVAPAGLTLGGGCEIALHADRVQAAAETYIGLVEVGVGLVPAGGGTKEMLARATDTLPGGADLQRAVGRVFETIGFGSVSSSAPDARSLGYLREGDAISMNRDRLMADAVALAAARAVAYTPPQPRTRIPAGGPGVESALKLGVHLAWRAARISDHDALIGRKLAHILAGGDGPAGRMLTEQDLLDLEREAFLSLCGERKTQERIAYTLKTGKTLRN